MTGDGRHDKQTAHGRDGVPSLRVVSDLRSSSESSSETDLLALRTLLVCDLVDSTKLTEEAGDRRAGDIFHDHDLVARSLLSVHQGMEVDKSDGFLLLFERPVQAVRFAMAYHHGLDDLSQRHGVLLRARVGIHVGEVRIGPSQGSTGTSRIELTGLAKPLTARIAALAGGGQTLLSGIAHELAERGFHGEGGVELQWAEHGPYLFKGISKPVEIVEVAPADRGALSAPGNTDKARRVSVGAGRFPRRHSSKLILALIVAAIGFVVVIGLERFPSRPDPARETSDYFVLSELTNKTGDAQLGETLSLALRIGLEQGRRIRLMPEHRMRELLIKMQRPPDSVIDSGMASEMAQRDGMAGFIAGSVSRVGGQFLLTAQIATTGNGQVLSSVSAQAENENALIDAVGELSEEIRVVLRRLTGRTGGPTPPRLADVTTRDLDALRAYSLAVAARSRAEFKKAAALFQEALRVDPGFAMARTKLGLIHLLHLDQPVRAHNELTRALEDAARLPRVERLYLEGTLSWFGTPQEMREQWTLMTELAPDEPEGHGNLGMVHRRFFYDFAQARQSFKAALERPYFAGRKKVLLGLGLTYIAENQFDLAIQTMSEVAEFSSKSTGRVAGAYTAIEQYQEAIRSLPELTNAESSVPYYPFERLMRISTINLLQGNPDAAKENLMNAEMVLSDAGIPSLNPRLSFAHAAVVQQLDDAEALKDYLEQAATSLMGQLDNRAKEPRLTEWPIAELAWIGKAYAVNGLVDQARQIQEVIEPISNRHGILFWRSYVKVLDAELLIHQGQFDQAIAILSAELGKLETVQMRHTLWRAYLQAGNTQGAAEQRDWLVQHRGRALAEYLGWWYFGRQSNVVAYMEAVNPPSR